MTALRIRPSLLVLALNWIAFAGVFAWISATQRHVLWWLRLDWSSWLTQLGTFAKLSAVPAGSVWILWLLASAGWTLASAVQALRKPVPHDRPVARREPEVGSEVGPERDSEADRETEPASSVATTRTQWQLTPDDPVLVAHAGLREKIQRLHQSLERI